MASQTDPRVQRVPLSREMGLRAGVILADESGIESLSMRRRGEKVGVEAMSLYNHVANKEDILDGIVDVVVSEIDVSSNGWKAAVRRRVLLAREILLLRRPAPGIIESRTNMSSPMLRYFDSLVGLLREAGFSIDLTYHAMHASGSRASGFTRELYDGSEQLDPEEMATFLQQLAGEYPTSLRWSQRSATTVTPPWAGATTRSSSSSRST